MSNFLKSKLKRALGRGEAESSKRDFPLIRQRLVENSSAETYEEACHDWDSIGLIEEEEVEQFTDHCQLCNQGGLKLNFVIFNPETKKSLLVGSTCIKRFIILRGTSSSAESWDYFVALANKFASYKDLQMLLPEVLKDRPEPRYVMMFRKLSEEILGSLNSMNLTKKQWFDFVDNLFGPQPDNFKDLGRQKKLNRVRDILFNPRKVPIKKKKKPDTGQAAGNWAGKGRRKARVITSLVMSEVYKNPQRKPLKDSPDEPIPAPRRNKV